MRKAEIEALRVENEKMREALALAEKRLFGTGSVRVLHKTTGEGRNVTESELAERIAATLPARSNPNG